MPLSTVTLEPLASTFAPVFVALPEGAWGLAGRIGVDGKLYPGTSPGLSLLLMLVSVQRLVGFPERGMSTIWLGHLLLGMAYATVVVQARLQDLNPQLEEAAMDLGSRPWQVLFDITLPVISPAILSGWLLAFTISLDEFLMAFFLTGTESTLPIYIWGQLRFAARLPSVLSLGTLLLVVSFLMLTLAEVLRAAGFGTYAVGKWHLAPMHETGPAGPFHNWPLQRGFNRYYGFLQGEADQFRPELVQDNHYIDPPATPEQGSPDLDGHPRSSFRSADRESA